MSEVVQKMKFSNMAGSICPESGHFRIAFLTYPRSKNPKNQKTYVFTVNFRTFCLGSSLESLTIIQYSGEFGELTDAWYGQPPIARDGRNPPVIGFAS